MPPTNRADQYAKLQKVARKYFQPVKPASDRSVFETLIYACCLENATFEQAEEAFARLQEVYHDWNEVRVTTIPELAESMVGYIDPSAAAARVKRSLHAIFETHYEFNLESLRKENLGKAIEKLKTYKGVTDFGANYVAHSALGGHVIPMDEAMLKLFAVLDLASSKEIEAGNVSGLERAIPKAKGAEFFTTVHPLAVQFLASPNGTKVWAMIAEIDDSARTRHNASVKAAAEKAAKEAEAERVLREQAAARAAKKNQPKPAPGKPQHQKPQAGKPAAGKPTAAPIAKKDAGANKPPVPSVKPVAKPTAPPAAAAAKKGKPEPTTKKQAPEKSAAKKPAPKPSKSSPAPKKPAKKEPPSKGASKPQNKGATGKPANKGITKKKPR